MSNRMKNSMFDRDVYSVNINRFNRVGARFGEWVVEGWGGTYWRGYYKDGLKDGLWLNLNNGSDEVIRKEFWDLDDSLYLISYFEHIGTILYYGKNSVYIHKEECYD